MQYHRAGNGTPPVVFVHGFACDSSDWQTQFDRLQDDTTVVACDLRGHGATPAGSGDSSIEAFGADVVGLLAELDLPPVVLVGHSMGCRVSLQAYLNAPDRVAGLVLLDSSRAGGGNPDEAERAIIEQLRGDGYEPFVQEFFEEMFVASSDPDLEAAIIARALALPQEVGAPLFASIVSWDLRSGEKALNSVRVPLLAIQTTTMTPERVRAPLAPGQTSPWLELVQRHVPTAQVEVISGHGHYPHIEAADQVSDLIAAFVATVRSCSSELR
ncbi:MAG: alpha/beta fold hydrolase [Candidatus Nanopelagicales bacterium]